MIIMSGECAASDKLHPCAEQVTGDHPINRCAS
jgi:hypothetical protein